MEVKMKYFKFIITTLLILSLQGCIFDNPRYLNLKSKPNDYYYSSLIYKNLNEKGYNYMIKKFLSLFLALLFTLTPLVACTNNSVATTPPFNGSNELEQPDDTDDSTNDGTDSGEDRPDTDDSTNKPNETPETNTPSEPIKPVAQTINYIRCTANSVNVRSGAGTSYSVLGSAAKGTSYVLLEKTGNWYKTYYKNKIAYVYAEYAAVFTLQKSDETDVENVIGEGYKLIGVPYVYGATRLHDGSGRLLKGFSENKFDCSSLVQYVFYKGAGVNLNTTTRTQVKQGEYVPKDKLKRGDCMFFTNEDRQYNTGIERVGHVAIYLGDDYILHTASDYARIEKMSATRWKFYIESRRFI